MTNQQNETITDEATETDAGTVEAPSTPQGAAEAAQEPQDGTPDDTGGNPSREAAKWRVKYREAEAERDALAGRVEAMTCAEIDRLAGAHLARGADLREVGGAATADLLGDDGTVDPDKVAAAAAGLLQDRPYLRAQRFQGGADGGVRQSTPPEPGPFERAAEAIAKPRR